MVYAVLYIDVHKRAQKVKMATIKIGNRNVSFSKGVYTANIGGKVVSEPSLERLKSKINLFKANRGVRAGKKVFARLRK